MREDVVDLMVTIYVEQSSRGGPYLPIANRQGTLTALFDRARSEVVHTKPDPSGWRQPTPYSAIVRQGATSTCTFETAPTGSEPYRTRGTFTSGSFNTISPTVAALSRTELRRLLPGVNSVEVSQAETRALNNLANRKGSFVESAAEARKTILGLAGNASAISDFLFAAAKKDYRGICKSLRISPSSRRARRGFDTSRDAGATLGGFWLNFWFGLSPIVSDMVSAAAYLSNDQYLNRLRVHGYGRSGKGKPRPEPFSVSRLLNNNGIRIIQDASRTVERGAECSLWAGIDATEIRRLVVYGAVDVPQTLWAVQPMSFLVDWVIPVSEILRAHTATVGLTFKGGTLTRKYDRTTKLLSSWSPRNSAWYEVTAGVVTPAEERSLIFERTVYKTFPKPIRPWIKDPFDSWKAITSLALLAGWTKNKSLISKG